MAPTTMRHEKRPTCTRMQPHNMKHRLRRAPVQHIAVTKHPRHRYWAVHEMAKSNNAPKTSL